MATKNPRGNATKKKQESKDGKLEAKPSGPKNPRGNLPDKPAVSKPSNPVKNNRKVGGRGKPASKNPGAKNPRAGVKAKSKVAAKPTTNPRPKKRVNATEVGVMKATPAKRRMTEPKGKANNKTVSVSKPTKQKKPKKSYKTSRTTKDVKKRENR